MKTKILIFSFFTLIFLSACKKDNESVTNLSGTVWKTSDKSYALKFTSETFASLTYYSTYSETEETVIEGIYTINGSIINITDDRNDLTGSINGDTIKLQPGETWLTFIKQ